MHKAMKSIVFLVLAVWIGCSESDESTPYAENSYQAYDLAKVDSIGIELGDSNYVFGAILDATYLNDGRIALLDVLQRKILVFSDSGEFIGSAGREGMGPGEFISPCSMTALSNGGFAVSDVQQGKIVFFNATLEFEKELGGFQPIAPDLIRTGPNGSVFGRRLNWYYDEDEEKIYSGSEYCLWSDSVQPDRIYREDYFLQSSDDHFSCGIASAEDGRFFTMPLSKNEYTITGYSSAGDISFQIELPWEIIFLTEEELLAARPGMFIPGPGSESTSSELSANWSPDSTRNSGFPIGLDDENRLWVKSGRGNTASPVFDLYNADDGSSLSMVETTLPAIARFWNYRVCEQGILGWDQNPGDYPRVYLLELVNRNEQQ
jgi:hypothetical protein